MVMIGFVLASLRIVPALSAGELANAQEISDTLVRDQQALVRPRPERGETVRNRARPELDPQGIRRGAFTALPGLDVREIYNDNIFSEHEVKIDDFITLVTPNLRAQSNWINHQLNLRANATIGRYASESDENFEDFSLSAGRVTRRRQNNVQTQMLVSIPVMLSKYPSDFSKQLTSRRRSRNGT